MHALIALLQPLQSLRMIMPLAEVLALEDRGLALTMTALRVAYAAGGDGEVCTMSSA